MELKPVSFKEPANLKLRKYFTHVAQN